MPASTSQADRIAYAEAKLGKKLTTRDALKENGVRNTYGIYDPWWGSSEIEAIDWQDELFRTAPAYDIQLAASGATDKINYSLSGGIYKQDGIVYGSSYSRYNLRANVEAQMTDRIRVGLMVAPSYGVQKELKSMEKKMLFRRHWGYRDGYLLEQAGMLGLTRINFMMDGDRVRMLLAHIFKLLLLIGRMLI